MQASVVTVFGGTGFVGRYVVRELVKAGYAVQVISRHPKRAIRTLPLGYQTRVIYRYGDISNPRSFQDYIAGSHAIINTVGILYERRKQRFSSIHAQSAERLAKMAKEAGVKHFIHISAIGADQAVHSIYARSKGIGEKAVLAAFPEAVILRPSVIFGAEDNFINQFARMACFLPFLPLIGGGHTKFQPIYVGDVAKAVVASLDAPQLYGSILELGGPRIYTFREILHYILDYTGQRRLLLPIPWTIAKIMGFFGEFLPKPFLTRDQVRLLKSDNLVQPERDGMKALGMTPTALEMVAPSYLDRFRGHYACATEAMPAN